MAKKKKDDSNTKEIADLITKSINDLNEHLAVAAKNDLVVSIVLVKRPTPNNNYQVKLNLQAITLQKNIE